MSKQNEGPVCLGVGPRNPNGPLWQVLSIEAFFESFAVAVLSWREEVRGKAALLMRWHRSAGHKIKSESEI